MSLRTRTAADLNINIRWYIPYTTKPIICNTKSWMDYNVKSHIKPIDENWKGYTFERNISTTASDNATVRFESNICWDSKHNPKTFWQYVNSVIYVI